MGSFFAQLGGVFSSPLGLAILALSGLAIAGIVLWAFWGQNDISTRSERRGSGAKIVPPPILSPSIFTGGASAVGPRDFTLRNIALTVLAGAAVVSAVALMRGGDRADPYNPGHRGYDDVAMVDADLNARDEGPYRRVAYSDARDPSSVISAVEAHADLMCDAGFTDEDELSGFRLCTGEQSVRFDRIEFGRRGKLMLNPSWNTDSGYTMSADNQPAPFGFDELVGIRGAADVRVNEYDAFIAIGLAETSSDKDADPVRLSAERAYALGRYTLENLRGEFDADCQSGASVMAVALGSSQDYAKRDAAMKPVLIGVTFDRRYSAAERDLVEAVNGFMRSRGGHISGYDLGGFSARDVLFVEKACPRVN